MPEPEKPQEYRSMLEASSLGWMFPIAIALGFGAGYGLDKLFHSWPWLTIIFTVFGMIAAFINLFRIGLGKDDTAASSAPAERTDDR
jgi:F0F1-type ATP synthase assembly protein I